jgi:galactose mutarotase-like enzyme
MTDISPTTITSGALSADIHPLGAQLFALRDQAGRDLQWNGDPAVWKGRAPNLFPIVGELNANQYRLDGHTYCLSRHGFARNRLFSLVESDRSNALFRLDWDQETFKNYPFHFQLDLHFAVTDTRLDMIATARNLEDKQSLPASFGFHPALRWPLPYGEPRSAHHLTFEKEEPAPIRRLDSQGLIEPAEFATPVERRKLQLRDDLFAADAIIFDKITSRRLRYGADHGPQLEIEFPGMPYLGIWTKPGAGYVCIEPWHGLADSQNYSGDFRAKPGMALIPPGAEKQFAMSITLKL